VFAHRTNESQKYLLPLFISNTLFFEIQKIFISFNISIYLSVCVPSHSLLGRAASGRALATDQPRAIRSQPELYGFEPKIDFPPKFSG